MARLITPLSKREVHLPEGLTIQQAIDLSIEEGYRDHLEVYNFGMLVSDRSFVIRRTDSLVLTVVPQGGGGGGGGKGILGALLMVALVVTAPYMAVGLGMTAGTLGAVAVATGITMIGGLLISALVKPPTLTPESRASYDQSPTYSLAGQSNGAKPYNPITKIYGRYKYFPNLASSPIISNLGTESRISSLYDFGYGHVQLEDIKIGDNPAGEFNPELYLHTNSLVKNTYYVNRRVGYDQFQYKLTSSNPVQIRSKPKAIEFDIDLNFGRGLYRFDDRGNIQTHSVDFNFQYRDVKGTWQTLGAGSVFGVSAQDIGDGAVRFSGSTARPFVAVVSVRPPYAGEFDFRAVKLSPDQTDSKYGEECFITMIKSYSEGSVVNLEKPHTMLEMRLLASDKISGTVQNLSAICTSVLRVTDDGVNFRYEATRNPAWIAVDILTGIANPKGLRDDLMDWASWIELANHCNAMGYHSDFVVDYSTTVLELLNSVLGVARASFTMTLSGKYGCLIDVKKTVPRQLITPANSRNFHGNRTFTDYAHAFLVSYVDPNLNWQKNQRTVYFDGYSENNATLFETLETFGITSPEEAWRYGRYMMAQSIHRAETFSVEMDIENLVVQRGDLVHVAHDVPRLGGQACRVVTVSGNEITINQELGVAPTGFTIRLSDGSIKTGKVLATAPQDGQIIYTIDAVGEINPDDLIVMGQLDRVVNPYIVTEIHPNRDLTAEIALVKYVPEVYTADTGDIPAWNPDYGNDLINTTDLELINLEALNTLIYPSRYPVNQIRLKWDILGFNYDHTDIYVKNPDGKTIFAGDSRSYSFYQLYTILQNLQWVGEYVEFECIPISASGLAGKGKKISVELIADTIPPEKPQNFGVNIQSEQVSIFWQLSNEPDLIRYEIRFTPEFLFPDWTNSLLVGFTNWDVNRLTSGARTGTYMIMAYDSSDNQSEVAFQRTTVESLPNIELVTEVDDADTGWNGVLNHLEKGLVTEDPFISAWKKLSEVKHMSDVLAGKTYICSEGEFGSVYPEGVYYFENDVVFDQVYEVRVSSYIQAHGEGEQGTRWHYNRINPTEMAYVDPQLWDCWLEYRAIDQNDFMSDWADLQGLPNLLGTTGQFTEWRIISAVGDVTGRIIQFRLRVFSKSPNIKTYVTDGSVKIDVTDRIWSVNDQVIPSVGQRIVFDPAFMFDTIAVAVSIDGNDSPVRAVTTNKNRLGFDLSLVNVLDQTPVSGKVDILVRGQGKERTYSI